MLYVLLSDEGELVKYPYSLTSLKRDNPNISFPKKINEETAAELNCFPVVSTEQPATDYTVNLQRTAVNENGQWVEQWFTTPATSEEIEQRTSNQERLVRSQRNRILVATDWTQTSDSPANQAAWSAYRKDLREITKQPGFPFDISWPVAPTDYSVEEYFL